MKRLKDPIHHSNLNRLLEHLTLDQWATTGRCKRRNGGDRNFPLWLHSIHGLFSALLNNFFLAASIMIVESFRGWTESPVATSVEIVEITDVQFPPVTVCPSAYTDTLPALNYPLTATISLTWMRTPGWNWSITWSSLCRRRLGGVLTTWRIIFSGNYIVALHFNILVVLHTVVHT